MSGALIEFDQVRPGPVSYGTPGVARNDLWLSPTTNRTITCHAVNPSGPPNVAWSWSFLSVPPGSAAVLHNAATINATFDPDLPGSYRVQLITNNGGPGNTMILVAAVRYNDSGVPVNRGWRLPAVGELAEECNFGGQLRGWDEAFEFIFADLLANAFSGGGGGAPVAPVAITASGDLAIPATNTTYIIHTFGAPIALAMTGTPADGLRLTFVDQDAQWVAFPFQLTPQTGANLQNPLLLYSHSNPLQVNARGVFTLVWSAAGSEWLSAEANWGYLPPRWLGYSDNINYDVPVGTVFAGYPWHDLYPQQVTITDTGSVLTGPFIYAPNSGSFGFACIFTNTTAFAMTVSQGSGGAVIVPPGTSASASGDSSLTWGSGGSALQTTLTGPGQTFSLPFVVPLGVTSATIKCSARVFTTSAAPGPGIEVVDDQYATTAEVAWKNSGGTVTVTPTVSGLPSVFSDASNVSTTVFSAGTTGTLAVLTCTTGAALDPTTTLLIDMKFVEVDVL